MDDDVLFRLIESLPDATFAIDTAGRVILWNRAMEDLTGVPADEMLGKGDHAYAVPFYGERRPILIDIALSGGEDTEKRYEYLQTAGERVIAWTKHVRIRGEKMVLEAVAQPLYDADGRVTGAMEVLRDVTEWKRTIEDLKSARRRLEEVHRLARIGTWEWDVRTDTITWSEELCRIIGWDISRPPPPYAGLSRFYTPESWKRLDDAVTHALETGEPYELELEVIRTDGERRWVTAVGGVVRNENGTLSGLHGTMQDITGRKRAEIESARKQRIIEGMLDGIPDIVGLQLPDHTIIRYNRAGYEILGMEPGEVAGKRCYELIGRTAPCDLCATSRALRSKKTETVERLVPEFQRYYECTSTPILDEHGDVELIIERLHDITERREMEEEIRKSGEQLRAVLDHLPIGVAINSIDPAVEFTYFNTKFLEVYRTTAEALAGSDSFWEAVYTDPGFREEIRQRVLEDCASGDPERMHWEEVPLTRPGEETVYINAQNIPIPDRDLMVSTVWDVTERKRAEEALRKSEEQYRRLVELAREGIWAIDADGYTTYANPRMAEMLGYTTEEMVGRHLFSFMDEEAQERARENIKRRRQGVVEIHEFVFRRRSGDRIITSFSTAPITDAHGTYQGAMAVVTDITEQTRIEEELRKSEELFRGVFEQSFGFLGVLTPDGTLVRANDTALDLIGADPESVLGRPFRETPWWAHSTDEQERLTGAIRRAAEGETVRYETTHQTADARIIDVDFSIKPVRDEAGSVIYLIPEGRDITDRRRAEEELRRSEERYHTVVEDQTEFICRFLPDGTHVFANQAYAAYFGMAPEDLIGSVFRPEIHPDDRGRVRRFFASLTPDHPVDTIRHRIVMPDGTTRWQSWSDRAIFDSEGRVVEYQSVGRDITDQKKTEEALAEYRRKLEEAMDLAHMAHWEFDLATGIFTFNDRFYALYGTTAKREGGYRMPAEVYAREFVHPDDRHLVADEVEKARETTDPEFISRLEHRIIRRDGEVRYISVRIGVILDEAGHPVKTHGVNQDITERREMEEEIRRSREQLQAVIDHLPRGILHIMDRDLRYVFSAGEELGRVGLSNEELVGKSIYDILERETADGLGTALQHVFATGEGASYEETFAGQTFLVRMAPLRDPGGEIQYVLELSINVTAEREAEEELRREKVLFESTFTSLQDAAFVLGAEPVTIRMANPAAEEIFGYSREEMVGRTIGFLHVDEASLARFREHVYPFLESGELIRRFRFRMKRKDGTIFPTEHTITPLHDPAGAHTGWVSLVRDITPEVEAERRERKAMRQIEENMEQLSTLNDQIRNPLAVIVGLVDMDCPAITDRVMEQAERIDQIITLLDAGWIRSEKTWEFLHRHYGLGEETVIGEKEEDGL